MEGRDSQDERAGSEDRKPTRAARRANPAGDTPRIGGLDSDRVAGDGVRSPTICEPPEWDEV
jgi:hypothetical protein